MSLVPDYDEDSSSTSDSDSDCVTTKESVRLADCRVTTEPGTTAKLPPPDFELKSNDSDVQITSVFTNPFIEAENAKKAVLEKHVKMVNAKDNQLQTINGKKICWNYRKGKCRFGHNCIYAHDSDLQKTKEQLEVDNRLEQTILYQSQTSALPQPTSQELKQIKEDSISLCNNKKRKRPGLTQGLVPGKKIMNKYLHQKK